MVTKRLFTYLLVCLLATAATAQELSPVQLLDSLLADTSLRRDFYLELQVTTTGADGSSASSPVKYCSREGYSLYTNPDMLVLQEKDLQVSVDLIDRVMYLQQAKTGGTPPYTNWADYRDTTLAVKETGHTAVITCKAKDPTIELLEFVLDMQGRKLLQVRWRYLVQEELPYSGESLTIQYLRSEKMSPAHEKSHLEDFYAVKGRAVVPAGAYAKYRLIDLRNIK